MYDAFDWDLDRKNQASSDGETGAGTSREINIKSTFWKLWTIKILIQETKLIYVKGLLFFMFEDFDWSLDGINEARS